MGRPHRSVNLWAALARQQRKGEAHRWRLGVASELQHDVDALPRLEHTIWEKHAKIRVAGARAATCVGHLDLERQAAGDREHVRVDRRRTGVRDPIGASFLTSTPVMISAGVDERDVYSARDIQELESHIATRQRIIVVWWFAAGWSSVNSASCCKIWPVYRVEDVCRSQLEHLRRRVRVVVDECRVVETVLEEISEVVHLIVAQAQATRRSRSSG